MHPNMSLNYDISKVSHSFNTDQANIRGQWAIEVF